MNALVRNTVFYIFNAMGCYFLIGRMANFRGELIHPDPSFIGDSYEYAYRDGYSEWDGPGGQVHCHGRESGSHNGCAVLRAAASLRGRAGVPAGRGSAGQRGADSRAQCPYWPQGAAAAGRAARQWRPNVIPYFFQTVPARRRRGGSALRAPCAAPPRKATGRAGWRCPPPLWWRRQICGRTRPAQRPQ